MVFLGIHFAAAGGDLAAQVLPLPPVDLVHSETRASLQFAQPLPQLIDLLPVESTTSEVFVEEWDRSWDFGVGTGRMVRSELYLRARGSLFEHTGSSDVLPHLQTLQDLMLEIDGLPPLPPHLALAVEEARQEIGKGARAVEQEAWDQAAMRVLKASDALGETTSRTVAATLAEAAESALEMPRPSWPLSAQDLRRARRLASWAREALAAGEWDLAVARAYYACQILGVLLP